MIFRDYPLNKDIADVLEVYARENSLNISSIIEELVKELLFKKGYLVVDEEITQTPEEIYSERKNRFHTINKGKYFQLHYDDFNFGVFPQNEIGNVINKLLDFSDEELEELSMDNWEYSSGKYKRFIHQKLDNPLLTPEEFMKYNKLNRRNRKSNITFEFNREHIVTFNLNKVSQETIEKSYLFLNNLSDEELLNIIHEKKRKWKEEKVTSSDFILEYITQSNNHSKKLKYVYNNTQGNFYIYRRGYNFGTHNSERITEVWNFLNNKDWDKKYSTNETGLTHKNYSNWLYSEMEKENAPIIHQEEFVSMEGK